MHEKRRKDLPPDMIHGVSTYIATKREGFVRGWVEGEGMRGGRRGGIRVET